MLLSFVLLVFVAAILDNHHRGIIAASTVLHLGDSRKVAALIFESRSQFKRCFLPSEIGSQYSINFVGSSINALRRSFGMLYNPFSVASQHESLGLRGVDSFMLHQLRSHCSEQMPALLIVPPQHHIKINGNKSGAVAGGGRTSLSRTSFALRSNILVDLIPQLNVPNGTFNLIATLLVHHIAKFPPNFIVSFIAQQP